MPRSTGAAGEADRDLRIAVERATGERGRRPAVAHLLVREPKEVAQLIDSGRLCVLTECMGEPTITPPPAKRRRFRRPGGKAANDKPPQSSGAVPMSQAVAEALVEAYECCPDRNPARALAWAFGEVNAVLAPPEDGSFDGRTAALALLLKRDVLYVASVGGARACLVRDGTLSPMTYDAGQATDLLVAGVIAAADAPDVTEVLGPRALGEVPDLSVDVFQFRLQPGDAIVVCAQALATQLDDAEIVRTVARRSPVPLLRRYALAHNKRAKRLLALGTAEARCAALVLTVGPWAAREDIVGLPREERAVPAVPDRWWRRRARPQTRWTEASRVPRRRAWRRRVVLGLGSVALLGAAGLSVSVYRDDVQSLMRRGVPLAEEVGSRVVSAAEDLFASRSQAAGWIEGALGITPGPAIYGGEAPATGRSFIDGLSAALGLTAETPAVSFSPSEPLHPASAAPSLMEQGAEQPRTATDSSEAPGEPLPAREDQADAASEDAVHATVSVASGLNMREAPGRAIICGLPLDTTVRVLGRLDNGSWYLVSTDEAQGWVDARFVKVFGEPADLPVIPTP